jgi:hypothetical protein
MAMGAERVPDKVNRITRKSINCRFRLRVGTSVSADRGSTRRPINRSILIIPSEFTLRNIQRASRRRQIAAFA